jgi:hypothetical protein
MSDTPKKLIVDIAKGTSEYIDLTPGEIAERDQQAAQAEVDRLAAEAKAEAEATAKTSAKSKLAALGLTEDEISALSD